jgi:hypothetical protein
MNLPRSAFAPRKQNSGKQHEGRRYPKHLQWIRGRPCILAGRPGHVCNSKIRACHVDDAGGKGMALKVADYHTVPGCDAAHDEMHRGAQTWQAKYKINLADASKQYAKASPHRHQWENL